MKTSRKSNRRMNHVSLSNTTKAISSVFSFFSTEGIKMPITEALEVVHINESKTLVHEFYENKLNEEKELFSLESENAEERWLDYNDLRAMNNLDEDEILQDMLERDIEEDYTPSGYDSYLEGKPTINESSQEKYEYVQFEDDDSYIDVEDDFTDFDNALSELELFGQFLEDISEQENIPFAVSEKAKNALRFIHHNQDSNQRGKKWMWREKSIDQWVSRGKIICKFIFEPEETTPVLSFEPEKEDDVKDYTSGTSGVFNLTFPVIVLQNTSDEEDEIDEEENDEDNSTLDSDIRDIFDEFEQTNVASPAHYYPTWNIYQDSEEEKTAETIRLRVIPKPDFARLKNFEN